MSKQHTIKKKFSLFGKGLHNGLPVNISFYPAPENYGYKIKRVDLKGTPIINAIAENAIDFHRNTTLSFNDEIHISMVEHALSALYALQVDNCLIEVDSSEFPILDGSAIAYVHEIENVGLQEQNAEREYYIVKKKIEICDETGKSNIILLPDDHLIINALISFNSKFLNNQFAILNRIEDFKKEISSCRTFIFVKELEFLLKNHLIQGGNLDNAIVIYEQPISQNRLNQLADKLNIPHKDASQLGYIMNKPLLYPNEPARHKLLDIIGDISLIGKPIRGRIIAMRPGHKINNQLARTIRKNLKLNKIQTPEYDPNKKPLMDVNRIRELLPHRYPFLLVDKIIDIGKKYIVGIKNVSFNEPFFQGHFPKEPIMPGVLLVESMAQIGGLLVLNTLDDPILHSTYFIKIDTVKFRQKVVPGDTLIFHLKLLSEIRRGIANMKGNCFVGEKLVCEAELMAQIVKNKS